MPAEYESYIDRRATGVMDVDHIRFRHGYPSEEDQDRKCVPSRNPEHLKKLRQQRKVAFPKPSDININMMPFRIGDKNSLPDYVKQYWPLIQKCQESLGREELDKVGYLTIHESLVKRGETQRRAGLHIECPGRLGSGGVFTESRYHWGCGMVRYDTSTVKGGMFMASTVADSSRVWDLQVRDPASVVGKLGDLEHLREVLGEGTLMEAETLYWMTDVTPHEALPMNGDTYRQFFRLVTSSLSAWYPENATSNPLGIVPDPRSLKPSLETSSPTEYVRHLVPRVSLSLRGVVHLDGLHCRTRSSR